jgi:Tol biopolymer transport system component
MKQKQPTNPPAPQTAMVQRGQVPTGVPQGTVHRQSTTPVAKAGLPIIPIIIGGFIFLGLVVGAALLVFGGSYLFGNNQNPTPLDQPATQIAVIPPTKTATRAPTKTLTIAPTKTNLPAATVTLAVAGATQAPTATCTPAATAQGGGAGQIAFASIRSGSQVPQIYIMDVSGKVLAQVTNRQDGACQPAWSPDGKKLVFVSPCKGEEKQGGYKNSGLFMVNVDTKVFTILPSHPAGDYDPAWSPDGIHIAFTSLRQDIWHIFVMDITNPTKVIRVSSQSTYDSHAAWSPDGKKIAFETTRQGQPQIWTIDATDTTGKSAAEFSKITDGNAFAPDWSPDGNRIIYSEGSPTMLASREYPPSVTSQVRIPNPPVISPKYSPDGTWVVFEDQSHKISMMTVNGSNITQFPSDAVVDFQPAWRPAGAP